VPVAPWPARESLDFAAPLSLHGPNLHSPLPIQRRTFLRSASAFVLVACLATLGLASASLRAAEPGQPKHILFFSKSSGFEHSVISYKQGQPSLVEKALLELGPKHHWEFTFSKDGSLFTPEYLAKFDAFFFYTTGNLCEPGTDGQPPMSEAGKQAFLDAIKGGKGFIGTHSAADTFHTANESKKGPDRYVNHGAQADAYVRMIGGEFIKHGKQQSARMKVVDFKFPGLVNVAAGFDSADGFDKLEEWYSLKDFSDDLHVLLVQETGKMEGIEYQRGPYPATWARMHGQGRVFYTSMGHRDEVWSDPTFLEILTGGIAWAVREVDADVTPNLKTAAPRAGENPPYPGDPKPAAPKEVKAK
jgi:type 1 glutamine amidotransferase